MIKKKNAKDILAESILELSHSIPINKITVSMIVENCGLSSRTFYNHFQDKDELVFWIYRRQEEKLLEQINHSYGWYNALVDTLYFFSDNKIFFKNAFKNTDGHNSFIFTGTRYTYESARKIVKSKSENNVISPSLEFQLKLYFYGVSAMTREWVVNGMKETPLEMAYYLIQSMPKDIYIYLIRDDFCE